MSFHTLYEEACLFLKFLHSLSTELCMAEGVGWKKCLFFCVVIEFVWSQNECVVCVCHGIGLNGSSSSRCVFLFCVWQKVA